MTPTDASRLALLQQVSLFRACNEAQVREIAALLREQRYRKGEILFQQGDPGGCLYIIGSGRVRVYLVAPDGREVTIRIYGAGHHVGEFSVLDGAPRSASIAALSNVTAFALYQDDMFDLLQSNFALVQRLLTTLTERLRYTTTYSENLAFLNAPQRVAAMLVQLAGLEPATPDPPRLAITQHDLAALTCITRESVNHALRNLAEQDIIRVERGAVVVLDHAALQRQVEAH
jgi:CRP/FNR family transcriptional regulator/CRP/FNR family cyclic AMP-dependent transcriptional regulator